MIIRITLLKLLALFLTLSVINYIPSAKYSGRIEEEEEEIDKEVDTHLGIFFSLFKIELLCHHRSGSNSKVFTSSFPIRFQ